MLPAKRTVFVERIEADDPFRVERVLERVGGGRRVRAQSSCALRERLLGRRSHERPRVRTDRAAHWRRLLQPRRPPRARYRGHGRADESFHRIPPLVPVRTGSLRAPPTKFSIFGIGMRRSPVRGNPAIGLLRAGRSAGRSRSRRRAKAQLVHSCPRNDRRRAGSGGDPAGPAGGDPPARGRVDRSPQLRLAGRDRDRDAIGRRKPGSRNADRRLGGEPHAGFHRGPGWGSAGKDRYGGEREYEAHRNHERVNGRRAVPVGGNAETLRR